tara:strand:- start:34 stop:1065 length:1032 start_codon:yes stop_codon:yes gene_type:complete
VFVKLKHVHKRVSKGQTYYRHRITGERLPDEENARIARTLEINAGLADTTDSVVYQSLRDLIIKYKKSPEFQKRSKNTQDGYLKDLNKLEAMFPDKRVKDITRAWIYELRDAYAERGHAAANNMVRHLRLVLGWALQRSWIDINPAQGVSKVEGGESHLPWPDEIVAKFIEAAPVGEPTTKDMLVRAVMLGRYTGQRPGDILSMQWTDISDGEIRVIQAKTGQDIWIPLHQELNSYLHTLPREYKGIVPMSIIHTKKGTQYNYNGFSTLFYREKKALKLGSYVLHGLRHTAGVALAEVGCTEKEIMAITGHETSASVRVYIKKANQKRLARSAIHKLESTKRD